MLTIDPMKRWSMKQVMAHPFVAEMLPETSFSPPPAGGAPSGSSFVDSSPRRNSFDDNDITVATTCKEKEEVVEPAADKEGERDKMLTMCL